MIIPELSTASGASTLVGRRITFLTHYTELYGANRSLLDLLQGLVRLGVQPSVIGPEGGELVDVLRERGIPTATIPFAWWVSSRRSAGIGSVFQNVRQLRPFAKQLREWNTELVYSNSSVFVIGAMVAAELELPHIWHAREFGRHDYDLWPELGFRLTRLVFRTADAAIYVSQALRRTLAGVNPPANSHVIYNGVAWEADFDRRKQSADALRDRRQPFTFVLVGRFRESKGQAEAIRAFAEVAQRRRDVRLLLVGGAGGTGNQSYFEHCQHSTRELAVAEQVEFWGYIPDPERAFLAADVALMCSRSEAMGRVTAEALSACRPVIGFAAGGTRELIEPGQTGLLYSDHSSFVNCLEQYASDRLTAQQHGEAGWHRARQRHSIEAYTRQIAEVLHRVLAN